MESIPREHLQLPPVVGRLMAAIRGGQTIVPEAIVEHGSDDDAP